MASSVYRAPKEALGIIRKHLRSFIKVVHPDITTSATTDQKKVNEQSLGELNNFLDLTDSLCNSGSDRNDTAALAQSSDIKLGINQTDYTFVFHVPIPDNGVAKGEVTMKEVKVNVAMPSKVQGLKSLNDTQKAVWLGSAANGAIELLNGAAIPISDDLQKLQLPVHKICKEKMNARGRTAQNEIEDDFGEVEVIDFESLIDEQVRHYETHGFQNVKQSSRMDNMRSKNLFKKFDKPKQRNRRIQKIVEDALYFTDDVSDDEAVAAHRYFCQYLYINFYEIQVWSDFWDDARICILKGIEKAEIQERDGVLCLPYGRAWGTYDNDVILQYITYGKNVHQASVEYGINFRPFG